MGCWAGGLWFPARLSSGNSPRLPRGLETLRAQPLGAPLLGDDLRRIRWTSLKYFGPSFIPSHNGCDKLAIGPFAHRSHAMDEIAKPKLDLETDPLVEVRSEILDQVRKDLSQEYTRFMSRLIKQRLG